MQQSKQDTKPIKKFHAALAQTSADPPDQISSHNDCIKSSVMKINTQQTIDAKKQKKRTENKHQEQKIKETYKPQKRGKEKIKESSISETHRT